MKTVIENGISATQWENGNELLYYPFEQESSSVLGEELNGVVVDLFIYASVSNSTVEPSSNIGFRLSSLHVGPGLVSASFSGGDNILVVTVEKSDFEPYRPYPMTSVSGDCFGSCSFGDVDFSKTITKKYGSDGPKVLECLVMPLHESVIASFVDPMTGDEVTGDVVMQVPPDVTVTYSKDFSGYDLECLRFKLGDRYEEGIKSNCDQMDPDNERYAGHPGPIMKINGMRPDDKGVIALVFE